MLTLAFSLHCSYIISANVTISSEWAREIRQTGYGGDQIDGVHVEESDIDGVCVWRESDIGVSRAVAPLMARSTRTRSLGRNNAGERAGELSHQT